MLYKSKEETFLVTYDSLLFLRKFILNPYEIGSLVPSSRYLAQKMVKPIPWHHIDSVAELGSGTGSITQFIESNVHKKTKVFLFEKDESMRSKLGLKFPDFSCHSNASDLTKVIRQNGVEQLDCIISCLPFFNFSKELRDTLVYQIHKSLKNNGYFIAFQYSLQMKENFSNIFDIEKVNLVPLNFPPAFVYVCRKKVNLGEL
jgi:phospholipid N-methyltransferase